MEAENNTETRQAGEDDGSIPLVGPPAGVRKRTRRACDRCSALRKAPIKNRETNATVYCKVVVVKNMIRVVTMLGACAGGVASQALGSQQSDFRDSTQDRNKMMRPTMAKATHRGPI
ncbi:hypothetical protein CGMCC3_g16034 [Colletotrichum fructicola]|nr:uncharacterized protein CGMCC3_g16034 [Colletotrichum fructicola]KAE9567824.1 hypothetical protein CGMCC3_g16034 [Colletotrichum fructicola]